ncbi:MAG: serine hydrolase [Bacteroidota bacterium]
MNSNAHKIYKILFLLVAVFCLRCSTAKNNEGKQESNEMLAVLRDSINQNIYKDINAIFVYHHGEVFIEEYYNQTESEDLHDARSVGKSIASAVLGIAIDEGYIQSLDQPLSDFYNLEDYKNYSIDKGKITVKDIITMSSNFLGDDNDFDTPGNEEYMYDKENWVKWALDLLVDSLRESGTSWHYFTAGVVILGDIIDKNVPNGLEAYAHKKLFQPLGNTNYKWSYTPQDVPSTAGNFRTDAKGFADFGKLYLQEGAWEGKQIISKSWVERSTKKWIETSFIPNYYGYLWWIRDYTVNSKKYHTAYCSGNGGNKIFTFKELDAVVVINASAYSTSYGHKQADEILTSFILPDIIDHQ